jgi:hypothetical protein
MTAEQTNSADPSPAVGGDDDDLTQPAYFRRLVRTYDAMAADANQTETGTLVWEGNVTELVERRLGYNHRYISEIRRELLAMGCVRKLDPKWNTPPSHYELLRPPDLPTYERVTGRKGRFAVKAAQRGDDYKSKQRKWLAEQRDIHSIGIKTWIDGECQKGATVKGLWETLNLFRQSDANAQRKLYLAGYPCLGFHGGAHVCGVAGLDSNAWAPPPDAATVEAMTSLLDAAMGNQKRGPGRPRKYEGRSD